MVTAVKTRIVLTEQELELLRYVCLPLKSAARELRLPMPATKMRYARLEAKLEVENRAGIVAKGLLIGLFKIDILETMILRSGN